MRLRKLWDWRPGLAPRIIGLVLVSGVVSALLSGILSVSNGRAAMRDQIQRDQQITADLAADLASRYVEPVRISLEQVSRSLVMQNALATGDYTELATTLYGVNQDLGRLENIIVLDPDGNVVARADGVPTTSSVADREWFQETMVRRSNYMGLPIVGRASLRPVTLYTVPILDGQGNVRLILGASISLEDLSFTLKRLDVGSGSEITLVDRRGDFPVLVHADSDRVLQPVDLENAARLRLRAGLGGPAEGLGASGEEALIATAPVVDLPWGLIVETPQEVAFAPIESSVRRIFYYSIGIVGLTVAIGAMLGFAIVRPVTRLRGIAQAFERGDFTQRAQMTQKDEIGDLARSFDAMAQAIVGRRRDLQTAVATLQSEVQRRERAEQALVAANDALEERVAERTAQLAASERNFRLLVDGVQEYAIFMLDPEGRVATWNAGAQRMRGYTPDEILGSHFSVFLAADDPDLEEPRAVLARTRELGSYEHEGWRMRRDGTRFWGRILLTAIYDDRGELVGYASITRDETERQAAAEALRQHSAELERSNEELERFAYVASHDLQEPLRMVSNYTQLLARRYKDKLDGDAIVFINYAVDGAQRMQQLINDLLAYSRVGTRGGDFERVEFGDALKVSLLNLEVAIRESGAKIEYEDLPPVSADIRQLRQLIQNLIANAIKFHGETTPVIRVSAEAEGDMWHFRIRDNGIGIEPQFAERIFVIFQRLHTRDEYPGTGIGLAICKRIIERHGGRIWVESTPGEGSTFHFTLPRVQEEKTPTAAVTTRAA